MTHRRRTRPCRRKSRLCSRRLIIEPVASTCWSEAYPRRRWFRFTDVVACTGLFAGKPRSNPSIGPSCSCGTASMLTWLKSLEWRREFNGWARSDGVTWIYIFKVLIAAFLTYWVALRLELPQPRTAMITVFIVMQPQSGHVFAKSFYRFLGTLAGSAVMVALIALFAQYTELFLGALAIWVGLCSAGAARNRNFRAYGFVLAGYTAAMVGLPALAHPEGAFMAAVWRVLEISLGILCSTFVSAAILPQTSSAAMRNALYQRFGVFAGFVSSGLRGPHASA